VDCLKCLYPEFDFLFFYDHSQGHARKRDGALDANRMSKNFGGAQPKMRDSRITAAQEFLGPYSPCLEVGEVQSMVFKSNDDGPWYLEKPATRKFDKNNGRTKKERTKKQLVDALVAKGVSLERGTNHTKKELQQFAKSNDVALEVESDKVIEGWEGKAKGLLQVLWERGFIDPSKKPSWYTMHGNKDADTGVVDKSSSLSYLMGCCPDFYKEEKTALEQLAEQLEVAVRLTPKFHAELAGEGVEYSWAYAKSFYRRSPLLSKKGRENFKNLVMKSTCPVEQLTKERICKFAARARAYICTYYCLDRSNTTDEASGGGGGNNGMVTEKQPLLYKAIERLMKKFKAHRCAMDFDGGFVHGELKHSAPKPPLN
jgi:hypothetical protein